VEKLRRAFAFGGLLSPDEIAYVTRHFVPQLLRVGEHFVAPGHVSDQIGFVSAGVCRIYLGRESGEEVTTYFLRSQQFLLDIESFYSQRPTQTVIQALTDCALLAIDQHTWQQLLAEVSKLFILSKLLTEVALLNKMKDNDFLHFGTAKQKYLEFLRRYPDLVLSVPQHYIASYLYITPQSLSRIRKAGLQ
jgi:CRP-like cAMP-binding protein